MAFLRRRGRTWYLVWKEGRRQFAKRVSRDRNIARERLRRFEEEADRAVAGLGRGDRYLSEASQDYHSRLRARVAAGDLAPATEARTRQALAAFLVWLQEKHPKVRRLGHVSRDLLQEYQLQRAASVRAKTVNTELSLVRPLFRQAVRDGALRTNPFDGIRKLKERDSVPARQLTPGQVASLLRTARKIDPELQPYLVGYAYTGARRSELWSVTWSDVDLEAAMLRVPNLKTSHHAGDRYRTVPIAPPLLRVLRGRRKFPRPWPAIPQNSLRTRFLRVTRAAGMPWLTRLHDLRHAFAGGLVSSGVSLYTVGDLLGHHDPRTTKRYSHLAPGALRAAVGKLPY